LIDLAKYRQDIRFRRSTVMRRERDPDTQSTGSARWQRRAARQDAERRRMPKHGKGYVDLTQRMIARRASGAAGGPASPLGAAVWPRRPSRARPPSG
jgi:hypothetical protein